MKKKEITLEEYQQAIETLTNIQKEKNLLKEIHYTQSYQCHFPLPETLDELLLTIKKENEKLDRQIQQTKKEFLLTLNIPPKITNSKNIELNNLIDEYLTTIRNSNNNNSSNFTLDTYHSLTLLPNFSKFHHQIIKLNATKETNLTLKNHILTLKSQESNALTTKRNYERKTKKILSKRKRRFSQ